MIATLVDWHAEHSLTLTQTTNALRRLPEQRSLHQSFALIVVGLNRNTQNRISGVRINFNGKSTGIVLWRGILRVWEGVMTERPEKCPHVTLKRKIAGETAYYQCECGQKFHAGEWDGKVRLVDSHEENRDD